jgi:hypothetical protein
VPLFGVADVDDDELVSLDDEELDAAAGSLGFDSFDPFASLPAPSDDDEEAEELELDEPLRLSVL